MRSFMQSFYNLVLRAQGGYLLFLAMLTLGAVPSALMEGAIWMPYLCIGALSLVVALGLLLKGWTPAFLARPSGLLSLFAALCGISGVFVVGALAAYAGIIALGLPEPLSRNAATVMALPTLVMTGMLWLIAPALGLIAPDAGSPPDAPQIADLPNVTGHVTPKRPRPSAYAKALRMKQAAQTNSARA